MLINCIEASCENPIPRFKTETGYIYRMLGVSARMKDHYTLNKFPKILAPRHEPRKSILWFSHFGHETETKVRWNSLKFEGAIMIYFAKISCFIFFKYSWNVSINWNHRKFFLEIKYQKLGVESYQDEKLVRTVNVKKSALITLSFIVFFTKMNKALCRHK